MAFQIDQGVYLVFDTAVGTTVVGAVWAQGPTSPYSEYFLMNPGKAFPPTPAAAGGTVRFKEYTNTGVNSTASFKTWAQANGVSAQATEYRADITWKVGFN
jgi:poly(3-hydroxybutyrate) depolymerase